jgi:hypothetical protein
MMKRMVWSVLFACCLSVIQAGYDDGLISVGEYESYVEWFSGTLIVDGGAASVIEAWKFSRIEVRSTTPLGDFGGITDLVLTDYNRLDYYGGETEELTIHKNAMAYLYGGRIDGITSMQYANTKHIVIDCKKGWSWLYTGAKITGITGLWKDGSPFAIKFIDHPDFHRTWMNVKVIPEPATLLMLGFGGLLMRRRR